MRRKLAGVLLIVHGLAHTLPGMRATEGPVRWSMTLAWVLAVIGFVAAGCMLLGLRGLNGTWRRYATGGLVGSAVLLLLGWPDRLAVAGLAIDAVILCGVLATRSTDEVIGGRARAGECGRAGSPRDRSPRAADAARPHPARHPALGLVVRRAASGPAR